MIDRALQHALEAERRLGVDVVALHLGFVPHDSADPLYGEVIALTRDLCDHCRGNRQASRTTKHPAKETAAFVHHDGSSRAGMSQLECLPSTLR